jgi:hypothetical protein
LFFHVETPEFLKLILDCILYRHHSKGNKG